jgi:hypothetical protein
MLVPLINLDDRRWGDLVEEGRSLLPLYAPEWTDHNIHDPGITLLELFAWIAESDIFQLNQIPERFRRKYLDLVGVQPFPPRPARAVLELGLLDDSRPLPLPASTEFEATDGTGALVRFRTLTPVTAVPGRLISVQRRDGDGWHDLTDVWRNRTPIAPFGSDPAPGAALYLGFRGERLQGQDVTLYFTVADVATSDEERDRLAAERDWQRCAAAPQLVDCDGDEAPTSNETDRETPAHHDVTTVWEVARAESVWQRLRPEANEVVDMTRAFTLNGAVTLSLPNGWPTLRDVGREPGSRSYVRCRFVRGAYDDAPMIQGIAMNGVVVAQAVPNGAREPTEEPEPLYGTSPGPASANILTWEIARGATVNGDTAPGQVTPIRLAPQAGPVTRLTFGGRDDPDFLILAYRPPTPFRTGHLTIEAERIGQGTGVAGQRAALAGSPVEASSLRLFTLEADGWRRWTMRPDFDASTGGDAHFELDATTGEVVFGDGDAGRAPPTGATIVAVYRTTRAEAGNAPAGAISTVAKTPHNRALLSTSHPLQPGSLLEAIQADLVKIGNLLAATGGEVAEPLAWAETRAADLRGNTERAVTLNDYETLARRTPGIRLARVWARANAHPAFPCLRAPGIITVVVLPSLPQRRPTPSRGLLRAVAAYLRPRRIVGTRVEVVGPVYREITVRARLSPRPGADATAVRARAVQALNDFFDPLHGGPELTGWPFGRDVYRSEVLQVLDETPGVDHVLSLELLADGCDPRCGNVCLSATGLVAAGPHQIEVE